MSLEPSVLRERITLEEWASLDEEVKGEFVDGALVEEEVPGTVHEVLVSWLVMVLGVWSNSGRVLVLASGLKLIVSSRRGRVPDVVVYLEATPKPPVSGVTRVPPSIVVEVVSAAARDARRDRVDKLAEYAAFGVRWYWLVDPALRSLEILELGADGRYVHALAATGGRLEQVPGCPGLVLDLDAAWKRVDEYLAVASP
ncbi:MAG: Uma2 family endonuclease [Polyangiaceae bacterium]